MGNELEKKKFKFPGIGMRIIKSAAAVLLCFLINMLRGNEGIVFYSQLAALWCMQSYKTHTKQKAQQRTIGTTIGALYGLVVLLITSEFHVDSEKSEFLYACIVSISIVLVLYTTVVIKKKQASYFSCVVFLSIVVMHVEDSNPFLFVWNRFLDTMIGIFVGILVNTVELPTHTRNDILFVSGLDDTLLNKQGSMSDYSKVELNRMIDKGAMFTISTMRTPASLMEPMRDIRLKLPVVAMDGAVLFDIHQKQYLKVYIISDAMSQEIIQLAKEYEMDCYSNVIIDDLLIIYYEESKDEVNRKMVADLRKSPYRNYVNRPLPPKEEVVYFMMLQPRKKMEAFYQMLCEKGYDEKLKLLFYDSKDYPGYSYLKIYNKNASKKHMIRYLTETTKAKEVISFGSIPGKYTELIEDGDFNRVVKVMKKYYEPIKWKKK